MSLVTGLFFLILLLNQRWSPPLRLQTSHCSTFRIMCDVPSRAVFIIIIIIGCCVIAHSCLACFRVCFVCLCVVPVFLHVYVLFFFFCKYRYATLLSLHVLLLLLLLLLFLLRVGNEKCEDSFLLKDPDGWWQYLRGSFLGGRIILKWLSRKYYGIV